MTSGTISIDQERCKGCGLCPIVCPQHVIKIAEDQLNTKGYHPAQLIDPEHACTGCAICSLICPDVCITVFREPHRARMAAVPELSKEVI
ncbi:MAG: ferredoxin family protein [Anaerolineae bacterium]|nr:ferredoxin family protein [Anaerolineae bacterium]